MTRRRRRPISAKGRPAARETPPPPLQPIPWGQPDRVLGEAICRQWLPTMMPATPWVPEARLHLSDRVRTACGWCVVAMLALLALALLSARARGVA